MKVIFIATVLRKHIMEFHKPYLKWFKENGNQVHICAKNDYDKPLPDLSLYCDSYYDLPFERNPLKINNLRVLTKLKQIINENKYDIIHCHTPVGAALARLAACRINSNTKVFYTAHGFHFYRGAKLKNWLLYYPVEYLLSKCTDVLITMNEEDYCIAQKFVKKDKPKVFKVNGVGINLNRFKPISIEDKLSLRESHGYSKNDYIAICVAELTDRKNQIFILNCVNQILKIIPEFKLLLVGDGVNKDDYQSVIKKMKIESYVDLLGYRNDVPELLQMSDVMVTASIHEGLPVNVVEAFSVGLPVIASDCRGNRDLVKTDINGLIFQLDKPKTLVDAIVFCYKQNINELKNNNIIKAKEFDINHLIEDYKNIYLHNYV